MSTLQIATLSASVGVVRRGAARSLPHGASSSRRLIRFDDCFRISAPGPPNCRSQPSDRCHSAAVKPRSEPRHMFHVHSNVWTCVHAPASLPVPLSECPKGYDEDHRICI